MTRGHLLFTTQIREMLRFWNEMKQQNVTNLLIEYTMENKYKQTLQRKQQEKLNSVN